MILDDDKAFFKQRLGLKAEQLDWQQAECRKYIIHVLYLDFTGAIQILILLNHFMMAIMGNKVT